MYLSMLSIHLSMLSIYIIHPSIYRAGQYLWRFMIAERYLGEPPERLFVDFCTIAKISVIVLDEKYHGELSEWIDEPAEWINGWMNVG